MDERSVLFVQVESNTLYGLGGAGGGSGFISSSFGVITDGLVDAYKLSLALHPWSIHLQLTGLTLMDLGVIDTDLEVGGVDIPLPWTEVVPGLASITGSAGTWIGPGVMWFYE